MSRSINIDNILNSDEKIFKDIVDAIEGNSLELVESNLKTKIVFNKELYDSIDFTITKLYAEESIVSNILYKTFGIGEDKNPRRVQLIVFGSQLKSEIRALKREKRKIKFNSEKLDNTLENLRELSESFGRKVLFIVKPKLQKKCNRYLKETYLKLDNVNEYKKSLDLKSIYLESCLFKYNQLLRKIPRYHLIREEKFLAYNAS